MTAARSMERTISLPWKSAKLHYAPAQGGWRTMCGLEYDADWLYRGLGCANCKTCIRAEAARRGW